MRLAMKLIQAQFCGKHLECTLDEAKPQSRLVLLDLPTLSFPI